METLTSLWSSPSFPTSHNFQSSHRFSYSQSPPSHSLSKHHFPFLKSLSLSHHHFLFKKSLSLSRHHFPFLKITFPFSSPALLSCSVCLPSSVIVCRRSQGPWHILCHSLHWHLQVGTENKYADVECKLSKKKSQESLMLRFTFKRDPCDNIT